MFNTLALRQHFELKSDVTAVPNRAQTIHNTYACLEEICENEKNMIFLFNSEIMRHIALMI